MLLYKWLTVMHKGNDMHLIMCKICKKYTHYIIHEFKTLIACFMAQTIQMRKCLQWNSLAQTGCYTSYLAGKHGNEFGTHGIQKTVNCTEHIGKWWRKRFLHTGNAVEAKHNPLELRLPK